MLYRDLSEVGYADIAGIKYVKLIIPVLLNADQLGNDERNDNRDQQRENV